MSSILITGAAGFVGQHLIAHLREQVPDARLFGLVPWFEAQGVDLPGVTVLEGDLTDWISLIGALRKAQPDYIFHLAALSYVTASYYGPLVTMETNALGTIHLLEAARMTAATAKVIICSSPEIYGDSRELMTEESPLRPVSPYALSKCVEDLAGYMYHQAWGLRTVISRGFAHEGPGRGAVFAVSDFARQVARIEAGLQEPVVKVGNLESVRTYCDVRDMVRAYWLLALKGEPGEAYNIAGDEMFSLREVLDRLLALSHIEQKVQVLVEESRLRPHDVWSQSAHDSKFRKLTNWRPQIAFSRTLADVLQYWRQKVR